MKMILNQNNNILNKQPNIADQNQKLNQLDKKQQSVAPKALQILEQGFKESNQKLQNQNLQNNKNNIQNKKEDLEYQDQIYDDFSLVYNDPFKFQGYPLIQCDKHPGQQLTMICAQKNCKNQGLICCQCFTSYHNKKCDAKLVFCLDEVIDKCQDRLDMDGKENQEFQQILQQQQDLIYEIRNMANEVQLIADKLEKDIIQQAYDINLNAQIKQKQIREIGKILSQAYEKNQQYNDQQQDKENIQNQQYKIDTSQKIKKIDIEEFKNKIKDLCPHLVLKDLKQQNKIYQNETQLNIDSNLIQSIQDYENADDLKLKKQQQSEIEIEKDKINENENEIIQEKENENEQNDKENKQNDKENIEQYNSDIEIQDDDETISESEDIQQVMDIDIQEYTQYIDKNKKNLIRKKNMFLKQKEKVLNFLKSIQYFEQDRLNVWQPGIYENLDIQHMTKFGWVTSYKFPYSHRTTQEELQNIYNNSCMDENTLVCIGVVDVKQDQFKIKLSAIDIAENVFQQTHSSKLAKKSTKCDDLYWYNVENKSFGFSKIETIYLYEGDQMTRKEQESEKRLSWKINGDGGYRFGTNIDLYQNDNYYKIVMVLT